jgi:hypothetical protein
MPRLSVVLGVLYLLTLLEELEVRHVGCAVCKLQIELVALVDIGALRLPDVIVLVGSGIVGQSAVSGCRRILLYRIHRG